MPSSPRNYEEALATFERRKAALDRAGPLLPKHQRAELISDLMEACDELDGFEAAQTEKAA